MTLLNAIALLALVGAGLALFPRFGSRWGFALVLVSLAAALHWYDRLNNGERWAFWLVFAIMAFHTFFPRWPGRRRIGSGAVMLVFTIILLLFDISGWWLFWTLLMLVVLFIAVAFLGKWLIVIAAFLAAVLLVTGWISTLDLGGDSNTARSKPGSSQPASPTGGATTGTGTPTGAACSADYVQAFDANKAHRFYSQGVKTSDDDLVYLGHDARTLTFRAFALHLVDSPDPSKYLEPGNACLSREGQDLYNQVKGALTGSGTKVDNNGVAPANGYNTGMDNGKAVVDTKPGVYGNRSAIVYTLRDGTKIYVMHRCGNIVLGNQPKNVPKGRTDNVTQPKPKPKPKPSPTTTLSPKKLSDHPAVNGNGPAVQWDPAPAPTSTASAPGGYSAPKSTATGTPSPTSTSTSTPIVVDPNPSNTSTSPPTW